MLNYTFIKYIYILLFFVFIISLTACSNANNNNEIEAYIETFFNTSDMKTNPQRIPTTQPKPEAIAAPTTAPSAENCGIHDYLLDSYNIEIKDDSYDMNGSDEIAETEDTDIIHTTLLEDKQFGRLPAIHITTENNRRIWSRDVWVNGTFSMSVGDDTLMCPGYSVYGLPMTIRERGHTTRWWPKRPYRVRFIDRTSLFGMPAARNWVLLANHADKSLIRNHIAMTMGGILTNMPFVPRTVLIDVYVNGVYRGVYILSERIDTGTRDEGRVQITVSDEPDTGFLIELGGVEEHHIEGQEFFHIGNIRHAHVARPRYEDRTPEQMQFIMDFFERADNAVTNLTNYEDYICIPALIDWFILHELTFNLDSSFRRSTWMIKDAGGKIQMGPPWDFDLAFGNFMRDASRYSRWASVYADGANWYIIGRTWMDYLLRCPRFIVQLQARWAEVGDLLLETALNEIDLQARVIYQSQAENFTIWPIPDHIEPIMAPETRKLETWEQNMDYLRNFLITRKAWMDSAISSL